MTRHVIPHVVSNTTLYSLTSNHSVADAAKLMTDQSIGVVLVMDDDRLSGIFSERDMVTRIVGEGRDADKTLLKDVMTKEVIAIEPETSPRQALKLMRDHHCRHLPIVKDKKVHAMVSVRDLYSAVCDNLEEDLKEKEAFIFNGGY